MLLVKTMVGRAKWMMVDPLFPKNCNISPTENLRGPRLERVEFFFVFFARPGEAPAGAERPLWYSKFWYQATKIKLQSFGRRLKRLSVLEQDDLALQSFWAAESHV